MVFAILTMLLSMVEALNSSVYDAERYDAEDLQTYPVERHGLSGAGTPKSMISTQAIQWLANACMIIELEVSIPSELARAR